ncbi:hypothetical protein SAMN05421505_10668 [Sinosporangium album]|uniref:DUF8094 domain-containing protein n=1 Tax=Sinosporangium album TaxID=504805 RepID=A0A1G7VV74_9ACTN|nr:hypothetical protein [Sinosporangium album]SDG63663.1 hypothetical protein SAMN05421505_10668 [Sinosporangium album]
MRSYGRPAVLTAGLCLLLGLTACSGTPRDTARPASLAAAVNPATSASARPEPKVTPDEAKSALRSYLALDSAFRAAGDQRLATEITRDGQRQLTAAAYRSNDLAPPRRTWGDATVIVPRMERFPVWFTAIVERRDADGDTTTNIMTFARQNEQSRWQLGFASLLYPGTDLPKVELDADGYATALGVEDESVLIKPRLMAPLHATAAEQGPGGFSSGHIAAGPHTTDYFAAIIKERADAKGRGLSYDSIFSATEFPVYALRTEDGGAMVQYGLTRTSTWDAQTYSSEVAPKPIPESMLWATEPAAELDEPSERDAPTYRDTLRAVETHQYVSAVPPQGSKALATVLAYDGGLVRATKN